jgi:hypothetical protein
MPRFARRFADVATLMVVAFTLAAASAVADFGARDWPPDGPALVQITVEARPLTAFRRSDPSVVTFGALRFRGGLVLTSSFKPFGGLSSLRLDADGQGFLAVSDRGHWFAGKLVYRGGTLAGVRDVAAAPILGDDGRPITERGWFDAESLARAGSTVYVGLERVHRILRFDFTDGGLAARGRPIATPPALRTLPPNKGLEALVAVPEGQPLAGALVAISERGLDADGHIRGFLIGGPTPGAFAVRRTASYDISDATLLPDGGLLLLERKFSLRGGIGVRIRRLALAELTPGAVVDGPTLFEADLGDEIDNFEGIDVHRTEGGETVITLVSDDNFSFLQRTLVMQFTLLEP